DPVVVGTLDEDSIRIFADIVLHDAAVVHPGKADPGLGVVVDPVLRYQVIRGVEDADAVARGAVYGVVQDPGTIREDEDRARIAGVVGASADDEPVQDDAAGIY